MAQLEESGLTVDFLDAPADYEPGSHFEGEVLLQGLFQFGTAVMLAEDHADSDEAETVRDHLVELFEETEPAEIEDGEVELITEVADQLGMELNAEAVELLVELRLAEDEDDEALAEALADG